MRELFPILDDVMQMVRDGELERADDTFRAFDEGLQRQLRLGDERGEHQELLAQLRAMRGALASARAREAEEHGTRLAQSLGRVADQLGHEVRGPQQQAR